jgi:hypothetical protein
MSKVLELSTDNIIISQDFYPDDEVVLFNPLTLDPGEPLPIDDGSVKGIFANFMLNKISWRWAQPTLDDWARCLEDEAILHVIVPSMRWISKQFWQEELPPHVKPMLFGEQTSEFDIGRNAFTMLELRIMFDLAGLAVIKAKVGAVDMLIGDDEYQAEQLYVAGIKRTWSRYETNIENQRDGVVEEE